MWVPPQAPLLPILLLPQVILTASGAGSGFWSIHSCSFLLIYFFSSNVVSFRGCRGSLLGYLSTFCPFSPFLLRAHRAVSRTFPLHPGCWAAFCPSSHRLCPRHPHRGCGAQPCPAVGLSWFPAQERLQHGFAPYYKSETPRLPLSGHVASVSAVGKA